MDEISRQLIEELNSDIAFKIPIFGGIPVTKSCFTTWIIMLILVVASIILTRNLKIVPKKPQLVLETIVGFFRNMFRGLLGEKGMCYFPYLATVLIFIGISNLCGLVGVTPPTKDLRVTVGLALMSIILVEVAGIRAKGGKGWLKSFAEPTPIIAPLNVLELFIKPLSLCMRLFGNVLGSFVIMELIKAVCPVVLPIPFSFYFDIFDGLLQAYVFVFLTSLYIDEAVD